MIDGFGGGGGGVVTTPGLEETKLLKITLWGGAMLEKHFVDLH